MVYNAADSIKMAYMIHVDEQKLPQILHGSVQKNFSNFLNLILARKCNFPGCTTKW